MTKIGKLLEVIKENLSLLDSKLESHSAEELVNDRFYFNSVLYTLQVAAQALIDLASHAIAESGAGVVDRYSAIPKILERKGVLERSEAEVFRKIIGFRNVVVHSYSDVSRDVVLAVLRQRKYNDILELAAKIAGWAYALGVDP